MATHNGKEIGVTGTTKFDGIINEDYNSKLSGSNAIDTFDKMRKSDGTIRATIQAIQLPIRRANWYVKPANEEDEKAQEVADFVSRNLFDMMSITWDDFLRQALLSLPFGVMVFEKVFDFQQVDGKDRIVWKKFAPRLPKSIHKWETRTGETGIQQMAPDGRYIDIPIEKLLVFVNEKEGDNWWGISILRAAYKHWYFKNNYYKIDAIATERHGAGVPFAQYPDQVDDAELKALEKSLRRLRANEESFITYPEGYEVGFMKMEGKSVKEVDKMVAHHNREIVKSSLAQFLELGATEVGSRALSEDQTDLFLKSIEAVANNIADGVNKYAVKQLVDLNFNVDEYPKLDFTDIEKADVKSIAEAYGQLTQSGAIASQESDEQFFREMLSLPEKEEDRTPEVDQTDTEVEEEDIDEQIDSMEFKPGQSPSVKKKFKGHDQIKSEIYAEIEGKDVEDQVAYLNSEIDKVKTKKRTGKRLKRKSILSEVLKERERKLFQEHNDFKGWRPLTFAEQKVNLQGIQDKLDELIGNYAEKGSEIMNRERRRYIEELAVAVEAGDTAKIKSLDMRFGEEYTAALREFMDEAYIYGKNNAAREMGVPAPANDPRVVKNIDAAAANLTDEHRARLRTEAKTKLIEGVSKGASLSATIDAVDGKVADKIGDILHNTGGIVGGIHMNHGRRTAQVANSDNIYALQRSEVLDRKTCPYCLSVDGRIVEKGDPFAQNTIFHSNCRGIWVEILQDEEEKPSIDGIPKSLKDRFDGPVNDLRQPENPIPKEDGPAADFVKEQDDQ